MVYMAFVLMHLAPAICPIVDHTVAVSLPKGNSIPSENTHRMLHREHDGEQAFPRCNSIVLAQETPIPHSPKSVDCPTVQATNHECANAS